MVIPLGRGSYVHITWSRRHLVYLLDMYIKLGRRYLLLCAFPHTGMTNRLAHLRTWKLGS